MGLKLLHNPIRTALIGFGFSGEKFHSPFLKELPDFTVTHVVSSRKDVIHKTFGHNCVSVLERSQTPQVLCNPEIDLIIISTPNADHYHLAKQALLNGKHVVVEKPFVLSVSEGEELIKIARQNNLILSVYHNRRWDSDFLTVQSLLQSDLLGKVLSFKARYDRNRPVINTGRWKESDSHGSGILWDLGAHLIDQALQLFGWPTAVLADVLTQRPGAIATDYFDIKLFYKNDFRVQLSSNSLSYAHTPKYEIQGTKGAFVKYGSDPQEQSLINGDSPLATNFGIEEESSRGKVFTFENAIVKEHIYKSQRGVYKNYFVKLAACINYGAEIPVSPKEALDVVNLILACEGSAAVNQVLAL